tara:strand:+ start:428 stop:1336 length:909 start_codon:yes stop_codon:yes gene_type:complete
MKEKNKIFLVLKGSKKTIFLIKRIKKIFSNSKIILIDKDKNCVAKNYAHKFINVDSENLQKIYKNISKKNLFMCITRSSGPSSVIALKINHMIGFQKPNINLINKIISKYYISRFCKINKMKFIKTSYIKIKSKLDYPLVIKSDIEKQGKWNVFLIKNKNKFKKYFKTARLLSYNKKVVSQEYIEGFDITVCGYIDNNKFVLKRLYKEKNQFTKFGSIIHSGFFPINFYKKKKYFNSIKSDIDKIIEKLNLKLTPVNFNFRVSKDQKNVYLNELNFFFGGEKLMENDYDLVTPYLKFLKKFY